HPISPDPQIFPERSFPAIKNPKKILHIWKILFLFPINRFKSHQSNPSSSKSLILPRSTFPPTSNSSMPVKPSAGYGTIPTTTAVSSSPTSFTFVSRAAATTRTFAATARPWREVFSLASFSRPHDYGQAMSRIKSNANYFRVNYTMALLLVLFLSLLWHPVSMIVFILVFVAWFFLYFARGDEDGPLVVFGRDLDDRALVSVLGLVTIVALVMTDVGVNVLVALIVGVAIVAIHGAFRGDEDLFVDQDSGGMLSFVGENQPLRGTTATISARCAKFELVCLQNEKVEDMLGIEKDCYSSEASISASGKGPIW
ncbi:PRA1 family protein E, partial [Linum perenne]